MSPRSRVLAVVALAAGAAVAGVVGVTLLQTRGEHTTVPGAVSAPRKGAPPLEFDFGVRSDAAARALARAASLYNAGHRTEAGVVFARYRSLEAQIGTAFATWPGHALDDLKRIVSAHPHSALAELHLGWAYLWSGRNADAAAAWKLALQVQPDSPAAVDADTELHYPAMAPGLPIIISPLSPPPAVASLPAAQELAALARGAARPDANAKLLYGFALWHLGRPVSAERQFRRAAALAPHDPLAQTLAAVGSFSKDRPVTAFSRLGPLTGVFPKAAVVRFHLGLLLIWTRQVKKGEQQLRLAIADNPKSVYAKQARALLANLVKNGTR
ncbi:MAG: tetratricopeptide repeat protein [Gaiellaceae bacterium]